MLSTTLRTHHCGQLKLAEAGMTVTLSGWVHRVRDHGGVFFIDLRDRHGMTQCTFRPGTTPEAVCQAGKGLHPETCVRLTGRVEARPLEARNPKLATGEIELMVEQVEVLNPAATPPFEIAGESEPSQDVRLRYRYIDLRRPPVRDRLVFRHRMNQLLRRYLDRNGFLEIETPCLTKSTPEGARDYLVPSRVNPGKFYALPQSPQILKQLLMVSGLDRYYQLARCFRDEDLRADRQPEFTQLDLEMSFISEVDIQNLIEGLMKEVFRELLGKDLPTPFVRLPYQEAVARYGIDRPDLRYPAWHLCDLDLLGKQGNFQVFAKALAGGAMIRGLRVPNGAGLSRKETDDLISLAKEWGTNGLAVFKHQSGTWQSSLAKFYEPALLAEVAKSVGTAEGDLILVVADKPSLTREVLCRLRTHLIRKMQAPPAMAHAFLWVVDFPMFQWNAEEQRLESEHHPFTAPQGEYPAGAATRENFLALKARAYDLVMNGTELGGGSIRIHNPGRQREVFRSLGLDEKAVEEKFGFFLEALSYGAPPHGGIALGLDRIAAMLQDLDNIREVIAFPKTASASCLLTGAPSEVDPRQLKELGINLAPAFPAKPVDKT